MKARVTFESLTTESTSTTFLHLAMALRETQVNPESARMAETATQGRVWSVVIADEARAQKLASRLREMPGIGMVGVAVAVPDLPTTTFMD